MIDWLNLSATFHILVGRIFNHQNIAGGGASAEAREEMVAGGAGCRRGATTKSGKQIATKKKRGRQL